MPNDDQTIPPDGFPSLNEIMEAMQQEAKPSAQSMGLPTGWNTDIKPTRLSATEAHLKSKLEFSMKEDIGNAFMKILKAHQKPAPGESIIFKNGKSFIGELKEDLLQPVIDKDKDMWWHPKNGEKKLASHMETRHLFFALRLLFNKVVPPQYRIEAGSNVVQVNDDDTKHTIKVLFYQIGTRDNITEDQLETLKYMANTLRDVVE